MRWIAAVVVAVAGCSGSKPGAERCDAAVDHLVELMSRADEKVAAGERAIIALVRTQSLSACREEGLSQAQADCIMGATTIEQFMALGTCRASRFAPSLRALATAAASS